MPDDSPDAEPLQVDVLLPDGGELVERDSEERDGDDGDDGESESETADDQNEPDDESGESDEGAAGQEKRDDEAELSADESAEGGDEQERDESTEGEAAEDGEEEQEDEEAGTNILHLDLDGLFLDLLGLEVDLDQVTLDLTARTGDGNLLGNLLSAVSGLLDGGGLGDLLSLGGGDGDGDGESSSLLSGLLPSMPEWPDLHPIERARHLASALADRIRELVDDVIGSLPIEALLAQFLEELVDQLVNGATDDDESDEAAGS